MNIKNKLIHLKDSTLNSMVYRSYYNSKIDDNIVYLESRNGSDFTGNIFRIAEELSTGKYGDLKLYVYADRDVKDKIIQLKKNYDLKITKIITNSTLATQILHKAKYIFTDSSIRPKYVKKSGQIVVNTWHGTPLKLMGYDNPSERLSIGIIQQSLLNADYLLYPNDYMMDKMLNAYMIEKIYPGKVLLEGYPRNSVFLDKNKQSEFKNKFNLNDKEIFVYMPTFKGVVNNRLDEEQKNDVDRFLTEIDNNLKSNQILYVKLHPYNHSKIDFSKYDNICQFPEGYEIYDILNMADCLITDYSSVFFDYANTGRKIIIFNYDEEDYFTYRGLYFPLSDLPFPKVQNVSDLIEEMNKQKNYDDSEFINKYCKYDKLNSVSNICETIFNNKFSCNYKIIENNNKNILIYGGSLFNNGITSSLINLLDKVDKEKYNVFISFRPWDDFIKDNYIEALNKIPYDVEFLPFSYNIFPTFGEKLDYNRFFNPENNDKPGEKLNKLFKRSYDKQYGDIDFDLVIDFDGYNHDESLIFANSGKNNAIWVHNDMIQEIKTRNKQNPNILKELYNKFKHVCVVSPDLIKPTLEISGNNANIKLIHNIYNYSKINHDSNKELVFDEDTTVYPNKEKLTEVLNSDSEKFISIGRFSPEKGHERLMKAFDEYCESHPDTNMIIIGGHGVLYEKTINLRDSLKHSDNIIIIKSISNPMPILKECDLFIVSSFYEGWPIVIMEADALKIPIIATDITGTQWMRQYGGFIVDNSQEGLLNGMNQFGDNGIGTLDLNYGEYNDNALNEFYSLLK